MCDTSTRLRKEGRIEKHMRLEGERHEKNRDQIETKMDKGQPLLR